MIWMPFVCLGIGFVIGIRNLSEKVLKAIDMILNIALVVLMLTIGTNIGVNDSVMKNLATIGINCVVIALSAILFSVIFTVIAEKTVLPLDSIKSKLNEEHLSLSDEIDVEEEEKKESSPLIWIMPGSIILGVLFGYFLMPHSAVFILDHTLVLSLVILYTTVGISLGSNKKVFRYIRLLGFRIIFISLAIFVGSLLGGFLSGLVLGLPYHTSVISAGGMSYYSLTGAVMTQTYGIETGTYGFIVNVMREFFTVLLLPLLIRISKGSPIASGAAGNMDTMLVPVTKFVGTELGLVALITGTILTFVVPVLLPALVAIL